MSHTAHHENHHHHHIQTLNRALYIGIALNVAFVLIEFTFGLWSGSLSLLTDAGHNLGDVAGLVMVVIAEKLALKKPTSTYTYGLGKTTILVALVNAVTLLIMVGAIAWEAAQRFNNAQEVPGQLIAWVALAGIIVNGVTAFLFLKDQKKDLNMRGAYLHMAADALVSLGVFVSGIVIAYTQWYWLDSVVSLVIVVVIVVGSWNLLRDSLQLSLDGVPKSIDLDKIKDHLLSTKGVSGIHDLHVWAMSTTATALTVHLVVPGEVETDLLSKLSHELHTHFHIDHTTIQFEKADQTACEQRC
ncbi:MAG: cation transporter [Bacteroidetes bacterium]|nr:cation transporter [Bacteroidota bacterium]